MSETSKKSGMNENLHRLSNAAVRRSDTERAYNQVLAGLVRAAKRYNDAMVEYNSALTLCGGAPEAWTPASPHDDLRYMIP